MRKTKEEAQKTRQHLLNAALEVFWRTGVTRATLQEIATEAGVTRGALYWHFKNKEDLFEALFEQKYALMMDMLNDEALNNSENVWQHLRESLQEVFRVLEEDEQQKKFCNVMFTKCEQTSSNETITALALRYHMTSHRQIYHAIEMSVARGYLAKETPVACSALYLESNLVGILTMWANEPERFKLHETACRIIDASMQTIEKGLLYDNQ